MLDEVHAQEQRPRGVVQLLAQGQRLLVGLVPAQTQTQLLDALAQCW